MKFKLQIINKGEIIMKKMNEKAMKAVNGGYGVFRCVCGKEYKYNAFISITGAALLYNQHMKYFCVYGRRFLNEMYGN
jgi:bacteriocin-like protein